MRRPAPWLPVVAGLLLPSAVHAQDVQPASPGWTLRTRVTLSGSSDESDPTGFEIYSGIGVEAALGRRLSRTLSTEVTVRFVASSIRSTCHPTSARRSRPGWTTR